MIDIQGIHKDWVECTEWIDRIELVVRGAEVDTCDWSRGVAWMRPKADYANAVEGAEADKH